MIYNTLLLLLLAQPTSHSIVNLHIYSFCCFGITAERSLTHWQPHTASDYRHLQATGPGTATRLAQCAHSGSSRHGPGRPYKPAHWPLAQARSGPPHLSSPELGLGTGGAHVSPGPLPVQRTCPEQQTVGQNSILTPDPSTQRITKSPGSL